LVRCLFLLHSLFLCVAYAAEASFDKKGLLEAVQAQPLFYTEKTYLSQRAVTEKKYNLTFAVPIGNAFRQCFQSQLSKKCTKVVSCLFPRTWLRWFSVPGSGTVSSPSSILRRPESDLQVAKTTSNNSFFLVTENHAPMTQTTLQHKVVLPNQAKTTLQKAKVSLRQKYGTSTKPTIQ
jgi:hypothetical protein